MNNAANPDRPLLGIMLMLAFCVMAPFGDALGKILGASLPILMIVAVRFLAQALLLGPIALASGARPQLTSRHWRIIVQRTVLHICGIALMFTALRYLPLADAIAIAFVMPFIMLLLGWAVLGEAVGPHRLAACGVGFVGTLLVIQPSFAAVGWAALLPLGVAVVFALFMLQTRQIAKSVDGVTLQAISGCIAMAILAPIYLVGGALGWDFAAVPRPTGNEAWLLLLTGIVGSIAHLFMTWSLRFAPSATLAPMQYLEIPFATVIGFVIFRDLPNGLAAIGILVTISAGLYVIWRERVATARPTPVPAPPAA